MNIEVKNGKIFCILKNTELIATPEEKVRQEFIHYLIEHYGYSPKQMAQEIQVNNSQRGQGKARADIVIWKSEKDKLDDKKAYIIIECKAENVKIHEEDYFQGYNYASWAGADFFVTTNQKETRYFRVNKEFLPKKLDEIIAIPSAKEINDEKRIKELLSQTKTFTRDEFTRMLFKCHNIIRNNDKLSPEAAFDEISKILFMKIKYEREAKGTRVFTKEQFIADNEAYERTTGERDRKRGTYRPYMQELFYDVKEEFKDDQLFEENEIIKIRQNSFEAILEELQKYNLSDTRDDVKGIAFEEFLGKTFRGELGQFFTPRTIVDFMTAILDPQEGETICDPTCGSGGFLIKSFEYIREKIENDIQKKKDEIKVSIMRDGFDDLDEETQNLINIRINDAFGTLNKELDCIEHNGIESRLYKLSRKSIYGTDANPRMARTSKMNMIMHGDGHGGVHHHDGLLNINGIFEERFDVILTNPPFGARIDKTVKISEADKFTDKALIEKYTEEYGKRYEKALEQVNNHIGKPLIDLFPVGKMSGLTEVIFIERCLDLLKPGGRMGIVLPEGVLNTSNLQKVREHFEGRAKIIFICSIPQDVFIAAGATVKPSLVFFKKFTIKEVEEYMKCKQQAIADATMPFNDDIVALSGELAILREQKQDKAKQREIVAKLNEIEKQIEVDAKPLLKEYFNYTIPLAAVEKAGITTTGAICENELLEVQEEFARYNKNVKLWQEIQSEYCYTLKEDGKIYRNFDGKEVILQW